MVDRLTVFRARSLLCGSALTRFPWRRACHPSGAVMETLGAPISSGSRRRCVSMTPRGAVMGRSQGQCSLFRASRLAAIGSMGRYGHHVYKAGEQDHGACLHIEFMWA